jgi:hypothetical protein
VNEIVQDDGFVPVLVQQFQCFKSILTDFSSPQQYDSLLFILELYIFFFCFGLLFYLHCSYYFSVAYK